MRIKHTIRKTIYPSIDDEMEDALGGAGSEYTLDADEFAAHADASLDTVVSWLQSHGFKYNIIAAVKLDTDGRSDDGSYAYRTHPLHKHQVHVHLFDRAQGVTIAAHKEYSITRPIKHYYGEYYSPDDGVAFVRDLLDRADPPFRYGTEHNTL